VTPYTGILYTRLLHVAADRAINVVTSVALSWLLFMIICIRFLYRAQLLSIIQKTPKAFMTHYSLAYESPRSKISNIT